MIKCDNCKYNKVAFEEEPCVYCEYNQIIPSDYFEPIEPTKLVEPEPEFITIEKHVRYILELEAGTLSFEQIINPGEIFPRSSRRDTLVMMLKRTAEDSFMAGHRDGRLERDLELKPLIKILDVFKYEDPTYPDHTISRLIDIYNDLPPLNEE